MHEQNLQALCAQQHPPSDFVHATTHPLACSTPQFLSRNSPSFCDASCTCCFGSLILTFPFPGCV